MFEEERIATNAEQATGREKEELEAGGPTKRFSLDPIYTHFGTLENPVMVPTGRQDRIVGCTGGVEGTNKHHDVLWMNLSGDMPHMCATCGQIFKLDMQDVGDHH
eukprot:g3423.t1